jgi:serine/threonine-protein kinase
VQAVHRAGVVHRDLKPDNIFLCSDGEGPATTKVLDFGVAAMRKGWDAGSASLTHTGAILGTPAYMALEQLKGEEVDARADVYALGAMLYEMVTGALPFYARTVADFAVLQATEQPVRPSRHRRYLRGAREQLLLRALARRPEDRYQEVGAFARALEAADGEREWSLRPLLVVVLCALLGFAVLAFEVRSSSESARDRALPAARAVPEGQGPVQRSAAADSAQSVPSAVAHGDVRLGGPEQSLDASVAGHPAPLASPTSARSKRRGDVTPKRSAASAPPDRAPLDDFTQIRLDDF